MIQRPATIFLISVLLVTTNALAQISEEPAQPAEMAGPTSDGDGDATPAVLEAEAAPAVPAADQEETANAAPPSTESDQPEPAELRTSRDDNRSLLVISGALFSVAGGSTLLLGHIPIFALEEEPELQAGLGIFALTLGGVSSALGAVLLYYGLEEY